MIETIIQLLKSDEHTARLYLGDAWMIYDQADKSWCVYQKKAYQRKTRLLGTFSNIDAEFDAVRCLIHSQD